ncbi:peptide deformylase [Candidatus Shapirobacteria bacterium]|nr:peptide deformylase [Candidatus Shapirobacteria bacterium]
MRKIVMYPNIILRAVTPEIEVIDDKLQKEMDELTRVLTASQLGAGLAAPQIGLKRRFFGLKDRQKKIDIYINPTIVANYGQKVFPQLVGNNGESEDFLEGCLSFPDLYGTVKRWLKIEAVWQELEAGVLVDKKKIMSGFEAIVFQHELDHLDGVLFIDHIKEDQGKLYEWSGKEKVLIEVDEVIDREKSQTLNSKL